MNLPRKFEEYEKIGVARKVSPDKSRAEFLIQESRNSLEGLKERVEKLGIHNQNANSIIKDCYDIILELIRAKLFLEGYNISGNFAHEAEISYLLKKGFKDNEIMFLNELRYFRNSITYYGKILDETYAKKIFSFMNTLLPKLNKLL